MGIPCVVGTEKATSVLRDGQIITVDGSSGSVFDGKGETKLVEVHPIVHTKTKIKVIVDLPEAAERAAKSGVRAVGLTRLEGIIASEGKHPLYFVKSGKINDYVELLFRDLSKIASHFEEVWVRTSDLRSDEFAHITGAPEHREENPMLGDHGIRFSLKHREVLKAEIEAIKKLAHKFPGKKFGIMMPQVISVSELQETKKIASELGIEKTGNVVIGIMVETPAAVQIINDLCEEGISFISFGTNDLTQYVLAIDRNNPEVQHLFNEMNPAVLSAISYVIRRCKRYGVETSICGQAGSKEEMARFLVSEGIDSISVNADAAEKVSKLVAELEKEHAGTKGHIPSDNKISGEKGYHHNNRNDAELASSNRKSFDYKSSVVPIIPVIKQDNNDIKAAEDIEAVILKELDSSDEENKDMKDDYVPGDSDSRKEREQDVPSLNDAIPVDSSMFEVLDKKSEEE
jgi:pyruvate,water dikinase